LSEEVFLITDLRLQLTRVVLFVPIFGDFLLILCYVVGDGGRGDSHSSRLLRLVLVGRHGVILSLNGGSSIISRLDFLHHQIVLLVKIRVAVRVLIVGSEDWFCTNLWQ
jgi:hypothetical protein